MAGNQRESGTTSFFEKGVEAMLLKIGSESSAEADDLRIRVTSLRDRARKWDSSTSPNERKTATDELFSLFRHVMERKPALG